MGLLNTLRYITSHPLNRASRFKALSRFAAWQLRSRIGAGRTIFPWINDTKLVVGRGETGLTGNIYCGLHEFEDMAFVLHFLRDTDLFVDVGANAGSYTVLAAGVSQCHAMAIEPIPSTFVRLLDNVHVNCLSARVECLNIGIGREAGVLTFTSAYDTVNRVVADNEARAGAIDIPVKTLDEIVPGSAPVVMKIDVEGYEANVIAGASGLLTSGAVAAVIMEINENSSRYGSDEFDLHQRMQQLGYSACSYAPFTRELTPVRVAGERAGNNTIYVRDLSAARARLAQARSFRVFSHVI